MIIQQKILPLMKQVDVHIQRKERLKTITLIEDKQSRRKRYEFNTNECRTNEKKGIRKF
jgi:hypothetical protein